MNAQVRSAPGAAPEHWQVDAGAATVAVLDIPGSLTRARHFDIDVSLLVRVPPDHANPWHELGVEIDGRREWTRRIASQCPGQTDGLDYHCRIVLETRQALRIRALVATAGSVVQQLRIEAREDL
jgi:hypothetical protein